MMTLEKWNNQGYRLIADFPDYVIGRKGAVFHRESEVSVPSVRGIGAVIQLRKDGRLYLVSLKRLVKAAFP